MANVPDFIATAGAQISTEVDMGAAKHLNPVAFGLEPYQWVSVAMVVLIVIFIWKKVPGLIIGGLDAKIAAIREQLDEAKQLRAEAEKLRNEYADKIANAEKDAEGMMDNARKEADAIVAKAEVDAKAMVERRKQMAEDKIAAAERDAVAEVKSVAVSTAAQASRKLIAEKVDSAKGSSLADDVIASI